MGDAQRLMHSGPFAVDSVIFTIVRDWRAPSDTLLLQGDCGVPQPERAAAVYGALLQRNYAGFQQDGPLFGVSPATGGIMYMERLRVADTSAAALAGTLAFVAEHARHWRCALPMPPRRPAPMELPCMQLA
jgi:hypothetical protein